MLKLLSLLCLLPAAALADPMTGVLLNPFTGYTEAIVITDPTKEQTGDLSACGPGCAFTDFMGKGDCMAVAISLAEGAYGYHYGPAIALQNSQTQALRHCQHFGGTACKLYEPICDR